jgi:hypothetical protein
LEVAYGVYDLSSRRVGVPLGGGPDPAGAALIEPPPDAEIFRELGRAVAASDRVPSWRGDAAASV